MVKKNLTVSVASRTIGGKTASQYKLQGQVTDKVTAAVGEKPAEVLKEAIATFGRTGANSQGKDSRAFSAYLGNVRTEMLRAVGEGRDATSRAQRAAIGDLMDATQIGYQASREASPEKRPQQDAIAERQLLNSKDKIERLKKLIKRPSKNAKRKESLKDSLKTELKHAKKLEQKKTTNHGREARIRIAKDGGVDINLFEKLHKTIGSEGNKGRKAIRFDAAGGFKLSDFQGKHDSVNKETLIGLKKRIEDSGIKFTAEENKAWKNDKVPALPATLLVQKMGGYFDVDNPKTDEQKRLANDETYKEALALSLLEIEDLGEGDASSAEQGRLNKLSRDPEFVKKQRAEAERSNKKQGLGAGSRGGKVKAAAPEAPEASETPEAPVETTAKAKKAAKPTKATKTTKTTKAKKATKPEPVKPEPVKPEPVKTEPVKTEVAKPKPVKPTPAKAKSLIGKDGVFASQAEFDDYKSKAGFGDAEKKQIERFFAESSVKAAKTASKYVIAPPSPDMSPDEAAQVEKLRDTVKKYHYHASRQDPIAKIAAKNLAKQLKAAGFKDPDKLKLLENTDTYKAQDKQKKALAFENQSYAPKQLITPFVNKFFPENSRQGAALAGEIGALKATDSEGLAALAKKHTWKGADAVIDFAKKLNAYAKQKREEK